MSTIFKLSIFCLLFLLSINTYSEGKARVSATEAVSIRSAIFQMSEKQKENNVKSDSVPEFLPRPFLSKEQSIQFAQGKLTENDLLKKGNFSPTSLMDEYRRFQRGLENPEVIDNVSKSKLRRAKKYIDRRSPEVILSFFIEQDMTARYEQRGQGPEIGRLEADPQKAIDFLSNFSGEKIDGFLKKYENDERVKNAAYFPEEALILEKMKEINKDLGKGFTKGKKAEIAKKQQQSSDQLRAFFTELPPKKVCDGKTASGSYVRQIPGKGPSPLLDKDGCRTEQYTLAELNSLYDTFEKKMAEKVQMNCTISYEAGARVAKCGNDVFVSQNKVDQLEAEVISFSQGTRCSQAQGIVQRDILDGNKIQISSGQGNTKRGIATKRN